MGDEDEEEDDISPEKPVIFDTREFIPEHEVLPILSKRHRSVAPVIHLKNNLKDYEENNLNSQASLESPKIIKQRSRIPVVN